MQSVVSCIETICQHCACYTFYFVWIGVFRYTESKQAPVDPALSGHHRGAEGRERRRVEGGCYSCGASRCSLIVPVVCAASNFNPPLFHADGAVSSIMDMRWLKLQSAKPLLITWALLDDLRVARLNVAVLCWAIERHHVFLNGPVEPCGPVGCL